MTSLLGQAVRLPHPGADATLILSYVTNSSGTFNLDSDKIIYLRDLGLPNEIITAMIWKDQCVAAANDRARVRHPSNPSPAAG